MALLEWLYVLLLTCLKQLENGKLDILCVPQMHCCNFKRSILVDTLKWKTISYVDVSVHINVINPYLYHYYMALLSWSHFTHIFIYTQLFLEGFYVLLLMCLTNLDNARLDTLCARQMHCCNFKRSILLTRVGIHTISKQFLT